MAVIITAQPQSTSVEEGVPAFFDVTATGTGTLTYQWYTLPTGAIVGEVSSALALGGVSLSMDGKQYYVLVTDDDGTVQSDTAILTVTASTDCPGYACDAYENALIASSAAGVWLMTDQGLDGAGDTIPATRTDYPLVLDSASDSSAAGLLADPCALEYAYAVASYAEAAYGQGLTFTAAALVLQSTAGTVFIQRYDAELQNSVYVAYSGNDLIVTWETRSSGQVVQTFTDFRPAGDHVLTYSQTFNGAFSLYINWVETETGTTPSDTLGGTPAETIGYYNAVMSHLGYWTGALTDASEIAALKLGWDRNSLTYVPPRGCNVDPPDPLLRTSLVWNFEDDNFTWMDAAIDLTTSLDPVVCMHYNFDAGFQTRWSDLDDLGVLWSDLDTQGTRWSDFYGGGRDQNMFWLSDTGVYKSDQIVLQTGLKTYFVEKTNIDLDESLGITTNRWKHLRQFYFHLQSDRSQVGSATNNFTFTTGWSKNLMDAPDWHQPIEINLQTTTNDGRHKVDLRTTGRYLALKMNFPHTSEFTMTGGDLDVEPTHGR